MTHPPESHKSPKIGIPNRQKTSPDTAVSCGIHYFRTPRQPAPFNHLAVLHGQLIRAPASCAYLGRDLPTREYVGGRLATSDLARRIGLPSDLSGSLRYLDDSELQRLREAVTAEIEHRASVLRTKEPDRANSSTETARIPEGKAKPHSGVVQSRPHTRGHCPQLGHAFSVRSTRFEVEDPLENAVPAVLVVEVGFEGKTGRLRAR